MTIENPELATVLVLGMAVLVFLQSLFIAYSFFQLNRRLEEARRGLLPAADRAVRELRRARELLVRLNGLSRGLPAVKERTAELSQRVVESLRKLDEAAAGSLNSLRGRLEQADRGVDLAVERFQQETGRVREAVVHPSFQASTIVQGLLARVSRVFAGDRNGHRPENRPQEEDGFV